MISRTLNNRARISLEVNEFPSLAASARMPEMRLVYGLNLQATSSHSYELRNLAFPFARMPGKGLADFLTPQVISLANFELS
jgi:hypothetical protein